MLVLKLLIVVVATAKLASFASLCMAAREHARLLDEHDALEDPMFLYGSGLDLCLRTLRVMWRHPWLLLHGLLFAGFYLTGQSVYDDLDPDARREVVRMSRGDR